MPPLVYQIAGGSFVIPAIVLLAVAVIADACAVRRWILTLCVIAAVCSVVAIVISAVALPWWADISWAGSFFAWLFIRHFKLRAVRIFGRVLLLVCTFCAAAAEVDHQRLRLLPIAHSGELYVIGDSISAGLGRAGETTWPAILRHDRGVRIVDRSRAGCTVAGALADLKVPAPADAVVLIEIGGNDVIGRTDPRRFGIDLAALVQKVKSRNQPVVMLELPLFPFDNAYGIEQRRVAEQFGIALIPRRYFAAILAAPGATLDGIHLSNSGQRAMAALVWEVIGPAVTIRP